MRSKAERRSYFSNIRRMPVNQLWLVLSLSASCLLARECSMEPFSLIILPKSVSALISIVDRIGVSPSITYAAAVAHNIYN